jgi:branched-subunit amino acid aminotransferase/4-amino-4-deoxychorismate lyase
MGELTPVIQVDSRVIGDGKRGPLTARLSQLFANLTATEGVVVV